MSPSCCYSQSPLPVQPLQAEPPPRKHRLSSSLVPLYVVPILAALGLGSGRPTRAPALSRPEPAHLVPASAKPDVRIILPDSLVAIVDGRILFGQSLLSLSPADVDSSAELEPTEVQRRFGPHVDRRALLIWTTAAFRSSGRRP